MADLKTLNPVEELKNAIVKMHPQVDRGFLESLNLGQLKRYKDLLAKELAEKHYGDSEVQNWGY